jgi:hypothetical protein
MATITSNKMGFKVGDDFIFSYIFVEQDQDEMGICDFVTFV